MYQAVVHTATGAVLKYGYCDFNTDYNAAIESIIELDMSAIPPSNVPLYYCKIVSGLFVEMSAEEKIAVDAAGLSPFVPSQELTDFVNENARVTDEVTGLVGEFHLMQTLKHRVDLYNDTDNPLYDPAITPILGEDGILDDLEDRVNNLENIHSKLGWHQQQVSKALYYKPLDLLIYYGWLNSYNYGTNSWSNEKVAQDIGRYSVTVLGDGIQDPTHGDYANTQVIIPRIKVLNNAALVFGYVSTTESINDFQTKVDQWNTLGVHGIFMDEAGYDFGTNRVNFNTRVDYVHGKTSANLVFVNSWNMDHIIGITNDPSYPNSTWNTDLVASTLVENDWALLESFSINTTAYSANAGYESAASWAAREVKAITHRAAYGINLAGVGVINNGNSYGNSLFKFGFTSALMCSLEAFGTSDASYGASSATVQRWVRPDMVRIGNTYTLNPSVQVDTLDSDVYHRYSDFGKMYLDFSTGSQLADIVIYDEPEGPLDLVPVQWMHVVTAGEVTAGYLTLPSNPYQPGLVSVFVSSGIRQINKQCVGTTGVTPDFDILSTNQLHINNSGGATGLSGDIILDDVLIVDYVK